MEKIKFRDDLLFGVATASTQIEGGDTNHTWYDWTNYSLGCSKAI